MNALLFDSRCRTLAFASFRVTLKFRAMFWILLSSGTMVRMLNHSSGGRMKLHPRPTITALP